MFSDKAYLTTTIAASVVINAFMLVAGTPWWIGVVVCVPIIVGGLLVKQRIENERLAEAPPQEHHEPPPPPPPLPPGRAPVYELVLPSANPDYRFLLSANVLWRQHGSAHLRPDQLAIDAVRERAARFTQGENARDSDLLAPRLAADLSVARPDRTGHLEAWAQDVVLMIPDADRRRLDKLAELRKDEEVWEHERAHEKNKRAYLRDDVLTTTGSAVVWWLARDASRVEEAVGLIGTLARLVAAAQDRDVEPVFQTLMTDTRQDVDPMERVMGMLLPEGSEPERADLADRLATIATEMGADDVARRIREQYDAPDFAEPVPSLFDEAVHPNGQPEPESPHPV
ncbi:hypothetical protein [Actinophytocola oryzae]|uniref:Uncharacterized protein n=1 Tax=Actinophytocola oryzae TaxID=502181 RepID=A0A4R7W437_9PSEU|nr:hypothetical protein [Actinophytocola oryzae]TDV57460.1 hypothetical protein CLV71_101331 [Actinophytocola oryzae]